MIDIPTVFILGAGASKSYGYSTADGLREFIIKNYCNQLHSLMKNAEIEISTIKTFLRDAQEFVEVFDSSNIRSIDKFLSINPSFTGEGKKAITLSILYEERQSLGAPGRTMASVCNERNIFFERPDLEPYKDVFDGENGSLRRKRSCQGRLIIVF